MTEETTREIAYSRTNAICAELCPVCGTDQEVRRMCCDDCWIRWGLALVRASSGLIAVGGEVAVRDELYYLGVKLRAEGKMPPLAAQLWTVWRLQLGTHTETQCTSNGKGNADGYKPISWTEATKLRQTLKSGHPECQYEIRRHEGGVTSTFTSQVFTKPASIPDGTLALDEPRLARLLWKTDPRVEAFVAKVADAGVTRNGIDFVNVDRLDETRERVWVRDEQGWRSEAEFRAKAIFEAAKR